jgi:hypothetical protein
LILTGGPRDTLKVQKGTGLLLDGYRRHKICLAHNLPFKTEEIDLPDMKAVREWMITNQLERRNVGATAAAALRSLLVDATPTDTAAEAVKHTARVAGCSVRQVYRSVAYSDALQRLPNDVRRAVGALEIAQRDVVRLSKMSDEQQQQLIADVTAGKTRSVKKAIESIPPSGTQQLDPRLFVAVENQIGACLRAVDKLHNAIPSNEHHQTAMDSLGDTLNAICEWREGVI